MEVLAMYDWQGNLSCYKLDNWFVPIADDNIKYQEIKESIANGSCIVNQPIIETVVATYNRKGFLSGYRWQNLFIPFPIDESKPFYQMVKKAIEDRTCTIEEPVSTESEKPIKKINKIIFCILFDQPWNHIKDTYKGKIPYQSNELTESKTYNFRLINLSSKEKLNKWNLLLEHHQVNIQEDFPIELPLQAGILELEVPVAYLQKLFRNEKSQLDPSIIDFIEHIIKPHLHESGRQEPDINHLVSLSTYYLRDFLIEIGNRIIEAFSREYGDLPIGYIDKWKMQKDVIALHYYEDETCGLGSFACQGEYNFNLDGEWFPGLGLLQMSEPTKHATHPYDYARQRCRRLLKAGLHIEAFCLLNSLLEINIRDVLCMCVRFNPDIYHFMAGYKMQHRERLEILKKIVESKNEDTFYDKSDYLAKLKKVEEIYNHRNDYIHSLILPTTKKDQHQSQHMMHLSIKQRKYVEELMHDFIDIIESNQWFRTQSQIADKQDDYTIKIIREAVEKRKKKDLE